MSAKLINQTGIFNFQYELKITAKPNHTTVNLHVFLPGDKLSTYLDSVTGTGKSPLFDAMLRAEYKWGKEFVKYTPEILK